MLLSAMITSSRRAVNNLSSPQTAGEIPLKVPGQWPNFGSTSDSGSDESEDIQDQSEGELPSAPDIALISELLESIERSPLGQEARILLMQHYAVCGWHDAAKEEAHRILKISPTAKEAQIYLENRSKVKLRGSDEARNRKGGARPSKNGIKSKKNRGEATDFRQQSAQAPTWRPTVFPITSKAASLQELEDGYVALLENAKVCLKETKVLRDLKAPNCESSISDLEALVKGRVSSVVRLEPPEGVKVVAEAIVADSRDGGQNGLNAAVKDLEDLARWCRKSDSPEGSGKGKSRWTGNDDEDTIREALVKRVKALKALLPENLQPVAGSAMMHAEHEVLHRKYINDETMTFDAVSDIPRAKFWTSEDGYAWDMEELARAITSGKGVMRNPLSKQMFTRSDIRAIIQHPLGKGLQALQVEQRKLKHGVRSETIEELDRLAKVLLVDMSEDGKPSHVAVETFVSWLGTLPSGEQKAIDDLKVPATDSHTGIPFDMTIGEAVKDVEGNRVCSHKAGDLLAQAVKYLKRGEWSGSRYMVSGDFS